MARFLVKASEFKNVCKAVNDRKLAELKKEIIEILKKQDEKEVKKAIDYFNSQELHYTHLEKSLSGKWIEKAGYGIGTVRIWKGKKYKKIAPGKWARVFDKEGRGTNIAIGKLIAKVQKIDNIEDLMAFVMQNKQRFVDENGIDLPVLDKLRAAVDAKNNGDMGSKTTSKPAEKKNSYDNMTEKEINAEVSKELDKLAEKSKKPTIHEAANYIKENNKELYNNLEKRWGDSLISALADVAIDRMNKKDNEKEKPAEKKTDDSKAYEGKLATQKQVDEATAISNKYEVSRNEMLKKPITAIQKYANSTVEDFEGGIDKFIEYMAEGRSEGVSMDEVGKEFAKLINHNIARKIWADYESGALEVNDEGIFEPKKDTSTSKDDLQKEKKSEKTYSVDNSVKAVSFDELQPIATNKSVGENEVQLPYSKDLANEIESLKNCVAPKWDSRDFMKHVYYENGKLITTDARRMKFIEVGELEGIPNGSYVDINTDKSGINIKKIDVDARFPNYSKVIPEDLKQSATLDTKLVKDKIKEMYKDGAISKKGTNIVQLEFRDGKVFIDDTAVGEAKDIKMKYGEGWGPARNDTNYMAINADYLVNALSGKTSVLQIGERADKAIEINTGSSSSILMPMSGSDKKMDYGQGRQAKKDANDKKAEERKKNKDYNFELLKDIREGKLTSSQVEKVAESIDDRLSSFTDEELQREWARFNYDIDKGFEKKALKSVNDIIDNKTHLSGYAAIAYSMLKERHPEIREKLATELEKRGISVKKSFFDDFIVDVFEADDEEEIEDELYEGETEYNDYSAEQPELFNSTAMKVREALDRINNQVL